MIYKHCLLLFFLFLQIKSFSQKAKLEPFTTKFQWVLFIAPDTTYKCTKFISEIGRVNFRRGFADTSHYLSDSSIYYSFSDEFWMTKRKGKFLLIYHFINKIDTIYSFNQVHIDYFDSGKWVQPPHREIGLADMLLEDIKFSYILQRLDQQISDSSIYLLYPHDALNFSYQYILLRLNRFTGKEHNFFIYKAKSSDFSGIQLVKKDSTFIPNKKLKRLSKNLAKVNGLSTKQCLRPGNPWLFIYKEKKFTVSNYCIRERRKEDKSLKTMFDIFNSFILLESRYFEE